MGGPMPGHRVLSGGSDSQRRQSCVVGVTPAALAARDSQFVQR
jgi:hypothetical protein